MLATSEWIVDITDEIRQRLYNGPIQRFCRRLGIEKTLAYFYWFLLFRLSLGSVQASSGDATAHFRVSNRDEFLRVRGLMEEQDVLNLLLSNLNPDDIFFDVGANVGIYTCLAGSILSDKGVVAIEPFPKNARRLTENTKLNDLNVTIVEAALSNKIGTAQLNVEDTQTGTGKHHLSPNNGNLEVKTFTGDYLVEVMSVPSPDVIKIDVEGAEREVIEGFKNILSSNQPREVYCEVHDENELGDLADQFTKFGYKVEVMTVRDGQQFILAINESTDSPSF